MTILISGGGIGGLGTAIALARHGIKSHILEQTEIFSEVGAGIQIGPNGMRILQDWGLGELLEGQGATPDCIRIYDGLTGANLNTIPLGSYVQERFGAPYKVFHRSELQMALLEKANSMQEIEISMGFRAKEFRQHDHQVTIHSINGEMHTGRLLIGADGLWSRTRRQLFPNITPSFFGKTAWRTVVNRADVPPPFNQLETGLWMAPHAHLVHYPVLGGEAVNFVAVISDRFEEQGWSSSGQVEQLLSHYQDWDDAPRHFLNSITDWQKWALFALAPLPSWTKERVCLLGDAAHPAIPFLAQGGVMALEDAHILAELLDLYGDDHQSAFRQYEKQRRPRATHVMDTARKLGKIYHMKGLMRHARNAVLTRKKPEKLLADYDWLYGFEITAAQKQQA